MAETHFYAFSNTFDGVVTDIGETDGPVPSGATIITPEQHATIAATIADGGQCRLTNGVVRMLPHPTPSAPNLAQLQAAALLQVDGAAETARSAFLTAGSGQALEYESTRQDAERALAAMAAHPAVPLLAADYPWLQAELAALAAVGVTATLEQVAEAVHETMAGWQVAGCEIKRARRTAKLAIGGATTPEQVAGILATLTWPSPP